MFKNPYLKKFQEIFGTTYPTWENSPSIEAFQQRDKLSAKYAWVVPTHQAIKEIVKCNPIIEIGAGTGYWADLIERCGGDIIAFDNQASHFKNGQWGVHYKVEHGDQTKVLEYPNRNLFLCWPPMSDMAFECVKNSLGNFVIYVGEGSGGCNATEEFFKIIADEFEEHVSLRIPQWLGLHDYFNIYKRKDSL